MAMADGPESPRAGDRNSKMHLDGFGFRELRPASRARTPLHPTGRYFSRDSDPQRFRPDSENLNPGRYLVIISLQRLLTRTI